MERNSGSIICHYDARAADMSPLHIHLQSIKASWSQATLPEGSFGGESSLFRQRLSKPPGSLWCGILRVIALFRLYAIFFKNAVSEYPTCFAA
jgi:hypothetical protein